MLAADGSDRRLVTKQDAPFIAVAGTWVSNDRIAASVGSTSSTPAIFGLDGSETPVSGLQVGSGGVATRLADGRWVTGSFLRAGPIRVGMAGAMHTIADGLSPAPSPNGGWVAFIAGATLRVVRIDGTDDQQVLDLTSRGWDLPFGHQWDL